MTKTDVENQWAIVFWTDCDQSRTVKERGEIFLHGRQHARPERQSIFIDLLFAPSIPETQERSEKDTLKKGIASWEMDGPLLWVKSSILLEIPGKFN
jgi:hypothetical protein